jgi:hypothetical protein
MSGSARYSKPVFGNEPYDPAKFTASGGMTWTVEAGDCAEYRYCILGKFMLVWMCIITSSVIAPLSNELRVQIPALKIAASIAQNPLHIYNGGLDILGLCDVAPGANYICIRRLDNGNLAASVDTTNLAGVLSFEIL